MGLRSVVQEVQPVFVFLQEVWAALPYMVQVLTWLVFGVVIILAISKSIWG